MGIRKVRTLFYLLLPLCLVTLAAHAQSFRVQCPTSTITHPNVNNDSEPAYTGPTYVAPSAIGPHVYGDTVSNVNGAIKCQQISGGDGYATMGDGTQTYMFSFGPLSGLADITNGQPGTESPSVFNTVYSGATPEWPGFPNCDPSSSSNLINGGPCAVPDPTSYNGAVGLIGDQAVQVGVPPTTPAVATATIQVGPGVGIPAGGVLDVTVTNPGCGYIAPPSVTFSAAPAGGVAAQGKSAISLTPTATCPSGGYVTAVDVTFTGSGYATPPTVTLGPAANACSVASPGAMPSQCLTGHVDPRQVMDVGVMNGNIPAPLMAFDEDDEFFLTLTNVGMIMRPDLFEQHTVHFHGYPNASSFYDGVPDASVAINIGGSFTYYYLAPDAGTYFWHCHITPPEHLQMGMVGQLYVRPRQNRVPTTQSLYAALQNQQLDPRTKCDSSSDILCSNPLPKGGDNGKLGGFSNGVATKKFAYNDGDGSTAYDVEYPLQIHGFDPNFHFVGMTFNPEGFTDMKDKYFLLNGRSYPDTVGGSVDGSNNVVPGAMQTTSADGATHFSQPLPSVINIPAGKRALLRISDLDVSEYQTLASLGIPMTVIALNAKLLRDQAGNNLYYNTNSITLGGGESLDVILDASDTTKYQAGQVFYLYTPNLDHLSNDAENFGGLMTEVRITN
ncbi:MAG TPA: multicopper oxidase domain-containing protein [Terriglobales bacterium]|nr:multicopper oxidase domain-containing protein [Terriglobales bacterium]